MTSVPPAQSASTSLDTLQRLYLVEPPTGRLTVTNDLSGFVAKGSFPGHRTGTSGRAALWDGGRIDNLVRRLRPTAGDLGDLEDLDRVSPSHPWWAHGLERYRMVQEPEDALSSRCGLSRLTQRPR